MSTQENKDLVRRFIDEVHNQMNFEAMDRFVAPGRVDYSGRESTVARRHHPNRPAGSLADSGDTRADPDGVRSASGRVRGRRRDRAPDFGQAGLRTEAKLTVANQKVFKRQGR